MVEYDYTVHYDPDGSNTSLKDDVEILKVVETGTGNINRLELRLTATFGKYLVSSPIIGQYDKIKVTITDANSNTLTRVYEVDDIEIPENAQQGNVVIIHGLGLEYHLQNTEFTLSDTLDFSSAFNAIKQMIDQYNEIRVSTGSTQASIIDHDNTTGNQLPQWNANQYTFEDAEYVYDGIETVVDSGGAPVANFGLGDFYEFHFIHDTTDNNQIKLRAFPSGSTGSVTITNSVTVNPGESVGGIEASTGTIVKAWGGDDGSLPPDLSVFLGKQEAFALFPDFDSTLTYPADAYAQLDGTVYQSNIDNNTSTPPTNWTSKTFAQFAGSGDYSIWTNQKAAHVRNSGSNPSPSKHGAVSGFNQSGMFDMNIHIADEARWQTDVIQRVRRTSDVDFSYLYGTAEPGSYRGLKLLVDSNLGALSTPFNLNSGNDRFGVAYSDKIVRRNNFSFTGSDEYKNWDVVGPLDSQGIPRAPVNGDVIAVKDEGKNYKFNGTIYVDDSATARANHCFHVFESIGNVKGAIDVPDGAGSYADNSAIQIAWRYVPTVNVGASVITSEAFYKQGAWFCLTTPYPFSTHNSVPTLGELWGNNSTKKEPVTFSATNMHLTHSGNVGSNNNEAKELGPLNSLNFWIKHDWFANIPVIGDVSVFAGDFKYRCALFDTSDNIVVQDFIIPHNKTWEQISLPFTGFEPYRARAPKSLGDIVSTLIPSGLEALNRFQWKNINKIIIQWQEPYDDKGRYSPEGSRVVTAPLSINVGLSYAQVNLEIDGLHFGKTMLAVTSPVTSGRVKQPPAIDAPDVTNQFQLDQLAESQLEIEKFQNQKFDITTEGRLDIGFGEKFYFENSVIVNRADRNESSPGANDGDANTIELVNKGVTHTIDKPPTGPGGFRSKFNGIKRLR